MIRTALHSGNHLPAVARRLLGLGLCALLLAGAACSTDNSEEQEAAEYPSVSTVPEKPETIATLAEANKIGEGLRADRSNARYTDEALRADTSVQPPLAPPPAPQPEAVTETVTETVTTTVEETTTGVTTTTEERVEAEVEERTEPAVAAAPQEPVAQQSLTPPASETSEQTTVISSDGVERTTVASVYEQQLAASGATRLPDGVRADGAGSDAAAPAADAPRLAPNYAAANGRTPVETLYFAQGSARLSAEDRAKIDRITRSQRDEASTIRIVGHASSRTRDLPETEHMMVNFSISQQRAAAVAEYFLKAGLNAERLVVESVSDSEPVSAEPMPRAEAMNRRVEIFILN